jgi:hypothetical protein
MSGEDEFTADFHELCDRLERIAAQWAEMPSHLEFRHKDPDAALELARVPFSEALEICRASAPLLARLRPELELPAGADAWKLVLVSEWYEQTIDGPVALAGLLAGMLHAAWAYLESVEALVEGSKRERLDRKVLLYALGPPYMLMQELCVDLRQRLNLR